MRAVHLWPFPFFDGTLYEEPPTNAPFTQRAAPRAPGDSRSLTATEKATLESTRKQFTPRKKRERQQLVSDMTITRQPGGAVNTKLLPARMLFTPAPESGRQTTARPPRSTQPPLSQSHVPAPPPPAATREQNDQLQRLLEQQELLTANPNADLPIADTLGLPEPQSRDVLWQILRRTTDFRYQLPFDPRVRVKRIPHMSER